MAVVEVSYDLRTVLEKIPGGEDVSIAVCYCSKVIDDRRGGVSAGRLVMQLCEVSRRLGWSRSVREAWTRLPRLVFGVNE